MELAHIRAPLGCKICHGRAGMGADNRTRRDVPVRSGSTRTVSRRLPSWDGKRGSKPRTTCWFHILRRQLSWSIA